MLYDAGRAAFEANGKLLGYFLPNGKRHGRGPGARKIVANRQRWASEEPVQSARFFVGFNVGDEPRWTMNDLVRLSAKFLERHTGSPSSSYIYQKGIYQHEEGPIVEEDGAQVIVLNLDETPPRTFEEQMLRVGEDLAESMRQEEVIVQFQRGGLPTRTVGVGA